MAWSTSPQGPPMGGSSASTGAHHGIFHNLITDVLDTAKGIVPGMVQAVDNPIRAIEAAAQYEKTFYSPLVTGQFGKFWHNVETHPLTPLLDALTLGSGVGTLIGGAAKAGEALSAGRISADFARKGTAATLKELPTKIDGRVMYQHLSPNVVRRQGQRVLIGATTKASERLGATDKGAALFGPGAPLDMSPLGRGNRALNRDASLRAAGTRGAVNREIKQVHHLFKKGTTPEDVAALIKDGFVNAVKSHAAEIHPDIATKLATSKRGARDWSYIQDIHDIRPPKDHTFEAWGTNLKDHKNGPLTLTHDPAKALRNENGNLMLVHDKVLGAAAAETASGMKVLHIMATKPQQLWKYLVLANAPRYFFNNLIGNSVMLMASTRPDRLVLGIHQAIADVHSEKVAVKALEDAGHSLAAAQRRLEGTWVSRWYIGSQTGPMSELQHVGQKFKKHRSAVYNSLFTLTDKAVYRSTYSIGVSAAIRELPQFQKEFRLLKQRGVGRTRAFREAADTVSADPAVRAVVDKAAMDWAGQYYHTSPVENAIRLIVPFYSWDRHALRFAKEQLLARPLATNVMVHTGQQGDEYLKQAMGGSLPDFLKGAVPLPDKMGSFLTAILGGGIEGRKKVLLTGGWNPLSAAAGDANSALALVGMQEGPAGAAFSSQFSPFISGAFGAITGKSLLSGATVKSHGGPFGAALTEAFGSVPAVKVPQMLAGLLGVPIGKQQGDLTKAGKPTLYHHSEAQTVRQILGIPVRDVSAENLAIQRKAAGPHKKKVVHALR